MDALRNQTSRVVLLHKICTPALLEMQQPKESFNIELLVRHTIELSKGEILE